MAYPDPYQRPAPDHFVRRWLFITACIAALMLLWQFLPAIEAWFSPREAAERTVTARGDLAADRREPPHDHPVARRRALPRAAGPHAAPDARHAARRLLAAAVGRRVPRGVAPLARAPDDARLHR